MWMISQWRKSTQVSYVRLEGARLPTRANKVHKELTRNEIDWLIFGADLLSSVDSPFESEAAALRVFKANEKYLVNLYREQRGSTGYPTRYFQAHGIKRAPSTWAYPSKGCYHGK